MNTYKIYSHKPYQHVVKANSEQEAKEIVMRDYSSIIITDIVNCSTPEYQAAYDNEQFDSSGRRRF
jgi:hypothetical protein